ncbi:NAD(P)/FAD-dependent oxidoreductase [Sporomusa acidovorans]|uniref:Nitrite reductase [NAD(P)H] n=1 Tax=Sporomusa acidovorans (strain ATCC 49682 / DSM 3132 / Mol) TaxID=1123286 RepID=A0ABZ3J3L3_SPOA4|nr:NAD(P)/FAD-dependent oxidoreductase [Sporomusa acidovorans]OZC20946.1 nitrite reductase [Sporomusa acidovorans DSM 3132]SDE61948.1 Nitrite/Sulfite reductase ferredoxin-like half domain-containing protein [Sporomusa acidovorans]
METKTDLLEKGAIVQRDRETYAIAPHIPGGVILDANVLRKIADVSEKYGAKALKLTSAQRIAIVGIPEEKIDAAWEDLGMDKGAAVGLCVRSVKICPATHFCKRAQQDGLTLGLEIDKVYHGMELPGKLKFGVSGCTNSCAECWVKDIGLIGTAKGWKVVIGGCAGARARIANLLVEPVPQEEVLPLINKIIAYYKENARKHERIGMMIDRLGLDNVKKDILG